MNDDLTIFGLALSSSVSLRGIFIPRPSIAGVLEKYADPALFFTTDFPDFPLTKGGSLTRVKYKERYFAITTCHQFDRHSYDYKQLILIGTKVGDGVTSHNSTSPSASGDQRDVIDCVILEFTASVEDGKVEKNRFLEIPLIEKWRFTEDYFCCFCIGYPSHRNNLDERHYSMAANAVWGEPCEPLIHRRISFRPFKSLEYEPDGMSGGPVFSLSDDMGRHVVELAGILTNASSRAFNFLPMSEIYPLLEYATR